METPILGWHLDTESADSLTDQLYAAFRSRLAAGAFGVGDRLPPSRKLAQELSVSRTTVTRVYDQLLAEGFLTSRPGSGLFVAHGADVESLSGPTRSSSVREHVGALVAEATGPLKETVPLLRPAAPDDRLFPLREWARSVARVARTSPVSMISEADPQGDLGLRAEICRFLAEWRGLEATPDQVVVTAGSSEALNICLQVVQPSSAAVEDPCYPPLVSLLNSHGVPVQTVDMDIDGACVPVTRPEVVILTPSAQFPLGGVMPQGRRQHYLDWATQAGAVLIEDDYDSEFRFAGRPIPALASGATQQQVMYVGSFSKVMTRSLRLGYLVVPQRFLPAVKGLIRYGTQASRMPQPILADFMHSGAFYRHIRRVRRQYRERRHHLMSGLQALFGPASVLDHKTGMQVVVRLPDSVNDQHVAAGLRQKGIEVRPLSDYAVTRTDLKGLVVGFAAHTEAEITIGLSGISQIYGDLTGESVAEMLH